MVDHEAYLSVLDSTKLLKTCHEIEDTLRLFINRFQKNQNKINKAKNLMNEILITDLGGNPGTAIVDRGLDQILEDQDEQSSDN